MAPTTRKRKLSPAEDSTKAAGRNTRTTKASSRGKGNHAKATESGAEDHGNGGFAGPGTRANRTRTSITAAKAEIRGKVDELVQLVEKQRQLNYVQDAGSVHAIPLEEAALRANSTPLRMRVTNRGSRSKAMIQPSLAIHHFKGAVKDYEATSKRHDKPEQPRWMRWEQDKKDLGSLNQEAMGIAARSIHDSIISTAAGPSVGLPDTANDMERVAYDLLEEALPKRSEETWGMAAREMLRAATGFLKLLPDGESNH